MTKSSASDTRGGLQKRSTFKDARQRMLTMGLDIGQIAAEFRGSFRLRPRAAWRHAHGWTLEEAAQALNRYAAESGRDPHGRVSVWGSQIAAYESWPRGGRKPSARTLQLMAGAYGTGVDNLLDIEDREHLNERDLDSLHLPLGSVVPPAPGSRVPIAQPEPSQTVSSHSTTVLRGRQRVHHEGNHPGQVRRARTLDELLTDWDALMKRREILTAGGGAVLGILAPGVLAVPTRASGTSLCSDLLTAHYQLTDHYRRLDNMAGAGMVVGQAAEHHRQLRICYSMAADAERARVGALVADSGALMGWLHSDLGQYAQAGSFYREAAEAARDGGDTTTYAYLLGRMSRLLSECRLEREALVYADAAEQIARQAVHPAARSWILVTRAWVHAGLGHERACRQDLAAASDLLQSATGQDGLPACIAFYSPTHLEKWRAHALMRLGSQHPTHWRSAKDALERTVARWPKDFVRGSAEVHAAVAAAHLTLGDIEQAVISTRTAYEVAARTGSVRNLGRVREVRALLTAHASTRAVRELDAYLLTSPGNLTE